MILILPTMKVIAILLNLVIHLYISGKWDQKAFRMVCQQAHKSSTYEYIYTHFHWGIRLCSKNSFNKKLLSVTVDANSWHL